MNRTTVAELVIYVTQLQPAQKVDEFTADAWFDVIGDLPATLTQGRAAVAKVARRQQWISAGDVRGELLRTIRPDQRAEHPPALEGPSKFEPSPDRSERIRRGVAVVRAELDRIEVERKQSTGEGAE